jgi:glycosyltransferase involved in cell wall biosynthesis
VLAPSLGESFGNAVVEGQLARRPVVATALQGHLETIVDEETGMLVPSEDPEALAAAVSRLLDEPDLASRLAARGRESALRDFSQSRYRDEICAVLSDMITSDD